MFSKNSKDITKMYSFFSLKLQCLLNSLTSHKIIPSSKSEDMSRGHIFSRVRPSNERAVSNLDRSVNISLWVWVAHSSFTKGSHMAKNMASGPVPSPGACTIKLFTALIVAVL
jgi:hypothetical protein